MPKGEINLHLRSKDSVAYSAPIIMQKMKVVPVKVEVDETGKIIKAAAETDNDKLGVEAETVVSKWMVRPFSYNGTTRKMRGILIYRKSQ